MKNAGLMLLLLLTASAVMAADSPQVDVRFVIEAQQFVDGLGSSRQSVERRLTQTLLDACRDQKSFPFLHWVNGDAAVPNRLVVALVEKKSGGDFETRIEYRATTKEGSPPPDLQETVYRWYEAKNADNADVVKARLQKKIREQFAAETFRTKLLRYFISRIPLAANIGVQGHRILVPVTAQTLKADEEESELAVTFFGKSNGQPGAITLREPLDYPQAAGVLCSIKDFNFADLPPESDQLPRVLAPAKIRDVRVTMLKYVYKWFPDSHLGSVTSD
ncbi:MAG TPA: hypothetical protein VII75_03120 [Thermoanaerobaculia bacterium]|nr:hypothetical protein [Thermoanaerobaculia bacterium]